MSNQPWSDTAAFLRVFGGVSLFTAIVTPLLLPVSPDAITCTQALLPALSPLVAPKPSSKSYFTINPRDHARGNSILLYNRPFRAQCVEVRCPEETALDDLSDCRSTDWGSGLRANSTLREFAQVLAF